MIEREKFQMQNLTHQAQLWKIKNQQQYCHLIYLLLFFSSSSRIILCLLRERFHYESLHFIFLQRILFSKNQCSSDEEPKMKNRISLSYFQHKFCILKQVRFSHSENIHLNFTFRFIDTDSHVNEICCFIMMPLNIY